MLSRWVASIVEGNPARSVDLTQEEIFQRFVEGVHLAHPSIAIHEPEMRQRYEHTQDLVQRLRIVLRELAGRVHPSPQPQAVASAVFVSIRLRAGSETFIVLRLPFDGVHRLFQLFQRMLVHEEWPAKMLPYLLMHQENPDVRPLLWSVMEQAIGRLVPADDESQGTIRIDERRWHGELASWDRQLHPGAVVEFRMERGTAVPSRAAETRNEEFLRFYDPLNFSKNGQVSDISARQLSARHDATEAFTTIARHLPMATRQWLVWLAIRNPQAYYVEEFWRAAREAKIPGDHLAFDEHDGTSRWPATLELPGQRPFAVEDRLPLMVQQQLLQALHVEDVAVSPAMPSTIAPSPQPLAQSQAQDYLTMLQEGGMDPPLLARIKQAFWGEPFLREVQDSRVSLKEVLAAADQIRELLLIEQRLCEDPAMVLWLSQRMQTIRGILREAGVIYGRAAPEGTLKSPFGMIMDAVNPEEAEWLGQGLLAAIHDGSQGNLTLPREDVALFVPGQASGEAMAAFLRDRIPLGHVMGIVGPSAELAERLKIAMGETTRPLVHVLVSPPASDGATIPAIEPALALAAALLTAATLDQVWVIVQAHQARQDGIAFVVPTVLVIAVNERFRRYQATVRIQRSA